MTDAEDTAEEVGQNGTTLLDHWGLFGAEHGPYRILLTGRLIDRLTTQHVREVGQLALAEWRVLAHLAAMGEKSASRISAAALVDRSEVSRAVAALERQGLIQRRPNPRNRKSHLLFLTAAGDEMFQKVQKERLRFFRTITVDLSLDERVMLDDLLLRVAQRAEALLDKNPVLPSEDE
jgi:DNA-binding MarR family transcriptional regulator